MTDNGGIIVIMDKSEYISDCGEVLIDKTSYERLPVDLNLNYRQNNSENGGKQ